MRRGEIWWADLDPTVGSEAAKRRPVILVSNDAHLSVTARAQRGVVTVVPVTKNVERVFSFQVSLSADESRLPVDSKAQAEQVRTIDVSRLVERIGELPADSLLVLDAALRIHLGL